MSNITFNLTQHDLETRTDDFNQSQFPSEYTPTQCQILRDMLHKNGLISLHTDQSATIDVSRCVDGVLLIGYEIQNPRATQILLGDMVGLFSVGKCGKVTKKL